MEIRRPKYSPVIWFNRLVASSFIGRLFRLEGSSHPEEIAGTTFLNELGTGAKTFAAMTYIIAVNASILSQTGGPCICDEKNRNDCDKIPSYATCQEEVRRDLVMATSVMSALSSFMFGLATNLPIALAPGMGLNAYFSFHVVGYNGSGKVPYGVALTAVFLEGLVFIFFALTGLRQWLVKLIPSTIKIATGAVIGLFLAEIGLSYGSGIGPLLDMCDSGIMTSLKMWAAIFVGGIFVVYLMAFRVKFAFLVGILLVSVVSWPRGTSITYFTNATEGDSRFDLFRQVTSFHPMKHTFNALDWEIAEHGTQFVLTLFTFLHVDIIDATTTLYSMMETFLALSISISALFGCSPVTAFIESGAGIAAGGRTGITAMATGVLFLVAVMFGPIFSSVPPWATGPTLILVGCLMARQMTEINWRYIGDTLPSFVVIAFVPFSYNVAYGIIAGMFLYATINILVTLTARISGGTLEPENYDFKEYWTWKAPRNKPWYIRMFRNSGKSTDGFHPQACPSVSDCEMMRVGSSDEGKEEPRAIVSVPLKTFSRVPR
ncbi:putative xanthine/uracil permease [Fusarium culmorum]|uniref:Putative xanthine/uracil permease n=1 Tax=Fusarium culmorum TaxID=5516 RepID=A0A2T4GXQ5_FUSCU|nr:putative xanthine/uracil permease [Fusarium culmorum]